MDVAPKENENMNENQRRRKGKSQQSNYIQNLREEREGDRIIGKNRSQVSGLIKRVCISSKLLFSVFLVKTGL